MDVSTAIVGFIFVCIVMPHLIKHKNQYYMAVVMVLLSLLLRSLVWIFRAEEKGFFFGFVNGVCILLQALSILVLIMASGGLSAGELAGNLTEAVDAFRHGEQEQVVIPLSGKKVRRDPAARKAMTDEEEHQRYNLDEEVQGGGAKPAKGDESIPLE